MERRNRAVTIGVRVRPEERAALKDAAGRWFDGNESLLVRQAVELFIGLRLRHGLNFEPLVAGLLPPTDERTAA